MTWNYRVVRRDTGSEARHEDRFIYDIKEVYYDDSGDLCGFSRASVDNWSSYEDLKGTVEAMFLAFDRPVLLEVDNKLIAEKRVR